MKLFAFAALAILSAEPASAAAATANAVQSVMIANNEPGLPGCAAGVIQNGELAQWAAYGLADVENSVPITPETRFDLGSMSKQFLAMAVLMLAADGKLSLDDDVHKYVPELPRYAWPVPLRDLLHHTSGLKDYDQLLQMAGWVDGDLKSRDDIFWIATRQPTLAFRPGTRYSYSDTNYFLLGLIAERISGEPLAKLLDERIFRPLGMVHTGLRTDRWALIPHKAWPYAVEGGQARLFINAEEPLGDGGIFSTVGDLALWERNFDRPKVGGSAILAEMARTEPLIDGSPNEYAAGLYVRNYRGQRMIEHSGASYGYLAEKVRFPQLHSSVIVLCNRRDAPYVQLTNQIADLLFDTAEEQSSTPADNGVVAADVSRFAGLYFSDQAADGVLLETRNGELFDSGSDLKLRPVAANTFVAAPPVALCRCATTYRFQISSSGAVEGFETTRAAGVGGAIRVAYVRMPPDNAPKLSDYTGEYISSDVATSWCIENRADGFIVRRRGFADRQLQYLWKDAAAGPSGILEFQRQGHTVTGFRLRNARVNLIEFRKLPSGQHPDPLPWVCTSTDKR